MEIETVADIKLAGRAINSDWPVSSKIRESVIEKLLVILETGVPDFQIAASKVLLAADALNEKKRQAEQRKLEAEHARKLQLIELAVKLGIARNDSGADRSTNSGASTGAIGGSAAGSSS